MTEISPVLRSGLAATLRGGQAFAPAATVLADLPDALANAPGHPHTLWDLVEHLRLAQADLLAYVRTGGGPGYAEPAFPDGYWPERPAAPGDLARAAASFLADLDALVALVIDPAVDLLAPLAHAPHHTVLREVLIAAEHNAHHLGQMISLRRQLGAWPGDGA